MSRSSVFFQLRSELCEAPQYLYESGGSRSLDDHVPCIARSCRVGVPLCTTTTTTIAVYLLPLGEAENSMGLGRYIDLPANANLSRLLQVEEYCGAPAGCCVQDDPGSVYVVVTFTDATGLGNFTVSLETPDMQSQEIGVAFLAILLLPSPALSFRGR